MLGPARKIHSLRAIQWLVTKARRVLVPAGLIKRKYEDEFTSLYESKYWGSDESVSGGGSSIAETGVIRRELASLLRELDIKSILDVPCGDFHWMSKVELCGTRYMGGDIVKDIVKKNQQLYAWENLSFFQFDIINDSLPKADLIICRDCLVHLPLSDARKALQNFIGSNSTFLLTTTFPERSENCDIAPGKWRPLNLEAKPFCLPQPWKIINEQCSEADGAYSDKSLGLWRMTDLKM